MTYKPCKYEIEILLELAGLKAPQPWGVAVGVCLEYLYEAECITRGFGDGVGGELTLKGEQFLVERVMREDTDLETQVGLSMSLAHARLARISELEEEVSQMYRDFDRLNVVLEEANETVEEAIDDIERLTKENKALSDQIAWLTEQEGEPLLYTQAEVNELIQQRDDFMEQAARKADNHADMQELMRINNELLKERDTALGTADDLYARLIALKVRCAEIADQEASRDDFHGQVYTGGEIGRNIASRIRALEI